MQEFKDRLEEALKLREMRPSELARLSGIGEGSISQYRRGAYKATQRNLEKMAKVLRVSIPWLMGAEEERGPAPAAGDGPEEEFQALMSQLTPEEQRLIVSQIKGILSNRE